jgi:hypothetical protein
MLFIYNFLCRSEVSIPDEDTQADPLDETVNKVEPEFGGLEKPESMSILQVLDKLEDVSDALLSRFDSSLSLQNNYHYASIFMVF